MKNVQEINENNQVLRMEESQLIGQERNQMLEKLYKAFDALKGHEILADNQTKNGFSGDKIFEHFNWSLFKSSDGILKITLENDLDYDSNDDIGTLPIYFKVDDIDLEKLEIDDNFDEYGEFLEDDIEEEYVIENIWVTLKNNDTLRLQIEW